MLKIVKSVLTATEVELTVANDQHETEYDLAVCIHSDHVHVKFSGIGNKEVRVKDDYANSKNLHLVSVDEPLPLSPSQKLLKKIADRMDAVDYNTLPVLTRQIADLLIDAKLMYLNPVRDLRISE